MSVAVSVAVVHLVRAGNPDGWLDGFLNSYLGHPAGIAHRLAVVLKGYDAPAPTRDRIRAAVPDSAFIEIGDEGFDITAYRRAAAELAEDRLCFLNSHAEVLADDWLARLSRCLDHPGMAAAAATASWERMDASTPFPNVHLRTNGFIVRREDFLALDFGPLATKRDSNRFEAGPRSMTRQFLRAGRQVAMIGRDGPPVIPEEWAAAAIFRSGNQQNLLIADNRTRSFDTAGPRRRRHLARLAWGERATLEPSIWKRVFGGER